MKHTPWLPPIKREHRAILERLERPPEVSQPAWRGVMTLLFVLASHYPRSCPGIDTIALESGGVSHRTVQYWIVNAKRLGLLAVQPDEGLKSRRSTSKTNLYVIPVLEGRGAIMTPCHGATVAPRRGATSAPKSSVLRTPEEKEPSVRKASPSSHSVRAASGRTSVEGVEKPQGRGRKVTASEVLAGMQPKYIKRPPRATDPDPARRMARYFGESWMAMVDGRPEFNDTRPWESKGATVGYLNKVFFKPEYGKAYTEAEVRAYIDRFIEGVRTGYTIIKRGQSAWMRFTGWWGRDTGTADSIFRESADKYLR